MPHFLCLYSPVPWCGSVRPGASQAWARTAALRDLSALGFVAGAGVRQDDTWVAMGPRFLSFEHCGRWRRGETCAFSLRMPEDAESLRMPADGKSEDGCRAVAPSRWSRTR
jgi:hypothetical protein